MEKLQAALENARKAREASRGKSGSIPPRPVRLPGQDARTLAEADLWEALTPFEVEDAHLQEKRVVTRRAGPNAAPFDILRTKVLLQMRQNGWKRLAITSPMPASGKTTTACNLALGLGRQKGLRAILMDLDLRSPSVHEFFHTVPPYSIGEVLSRKVEFGQQALRLGENVACSMAQSGEGDPTQLLLSEETAEVIDDIEAAYAPDLMIFDLPSLLVNDDTRAFLKNVDCALIVVRANATKYNQFDVCEREISEQTNVLGTVLNAYTNVDPQNE
jgi:Mrp family chromosome partitioning ATPase